MKGGGTEDVHAAAQAGISAGGGALVCSSENEASSEGDIGAEQGRQSEGTERPGAPKFEFVVQKVRDTRENAVLGEYSSWRLRLVSLHEPIAADTTVADLVASGADVTIDGAPVEFSGGTLRCAGLGANEAALLKTQPLDQLEQGVPTNSLSGEADPTQENEIPEACGHLTEFNPDDPFWDTLYYQAIRELEKQVAVSRVGQDVATNLGMQGVNLWLVLFQAVDEGNTSAIANGITTDVQSGKAYPIGADGGHLVTAMILVAETAYRNDPRWERCAPFVNKLRPELIEWVAAKERAIRADAERKRGDFPVTFRGRASREEEVEEEDEDEGRDDFDEPAPVRAP